MDNYVMFVLIPLLVIFYSIINYKEKSIKFFLITTISLLFLITILLNESILDNILFQIIKFLYFPNIVSLIFIIVCVLGLFILLKLRNVNIVINLLYFLMIFVILISLILMEVDFKSYNSLYSGISLFMIRVISFGFLIDIILNLLILIKRKTNTK